MMTESQLKVAIMEATVHLPKLGGQGVLVPGNLILTAAHCISWDSSGGMTLGGIHIEDVECRGQSLKVTPLAVEPVSDIAVLGSLDDQNFFQEATDFDAFCDNTKRIRVRITDAPLNQPFPVYILTHKGAWVSAEAQKHEIVTPHFWMEFDKGESIKPGMSGSAVVDEDGLLIGIVSNTDEKSNGFTPCPHLALPTWVLRQIMSGSNL